ncbi:MAG: MerR family transcriptional regulator [Candidatus Rokubacteria bacterium]|nr:MerR family transcriptional regulator [Candidatus Rokubacteria bacterium]
MAAGPIPDKLFFRIGEVADLTGVPPYVLRYWESEFKLLRPRKNHAGQRVYRKPDIELVLRIKGLLYEDRLTLLAAARAPGSRPADAGGAAAPPGSAGGDATAPARSGADFA